jgi:hypothetical protein
MACKYLYEGSEYSKEELLEVLKRDDKLNKLSLLELRSITTKPKTSDIISKSVTLMQQRKIDAINMKKTIKNSNMSRQEKINNIVKYDKIIEEANETIKNLKTVTPSKKLSLILTTAENDMKIVDAAFKSNNISINDFRIVLDIVETWNKINDLLGIESIDSLSDKKEIILDLEGNKTEIESPKERLKKIKAAYSLYAEDTRKVALDLIEKSTTGVKIYKKELLKIVDT